MAILASRRAVAAGLIAAVPVAAGVSWLARDTESLKRTAAMIRAPLDVSATGDARVSELVRFATLAPNSHNTQPWHFSGDADQIIMMPDPARATPVVDPDDHHMHVSLGAAAETLVVAASGYGLAARSAFDAKTGGIRTMLAPGATVSPLLASVTQRQSNRSTYDGTALDPSDRKALLHEAAGSGVELHMIEEAGAKAALRDLVVAGNITQMEDPAFVVELLSWLRFSEAAALARGDGLFAGCSGNPALPQWIGECIFPLVFTEPSETAKLVAQIDSAAALVLLVSAGDSPAHWVETGRVLARLTLRATELGLAHAHVNQALEVPAQRAAVAAMFGLAAGRPSILLRIGHAAPMPYAVRRPVADVLI
jgi:hypothetical protein